MSLGSLTVICLCMSDLFAYLSIVFCCMLMHIVLLYDHGETSMLRLRPVRTTGHLTLIHCFDTVSAISWVVRSTKNISSQKWPR